MTPPSLPARPSRRIVAAEVRAGMARADLTQGDIVDLLKDAGVELSRTGLSERLNGHRAFNTDHLEAIAEILGVDIFTLLAPPSASSVGAAS